MACCSNKCNCNDDSASACALKNILDSLDDLNAQDLCTLRNVINRIIICNS
jgi:hypothetical protein